MSPMNVQSKDPLHGVTLKNMLEMLLDQYGWDGLDRLIRVNCFHENPSINSSLKFLRKTPWARLKVEELYISSFKNEIDKKNLV